MLSGGSDLYQGIWGNGRNCVFLYVMTSNIRSKYKPKINPHLLWEYDLDAFDFYKSGRIVIERVVERGDMNDWREMIKFYSEKEILEVVSKSRQLSDKDKNFTKIFINSPLLHAAHK